MAIAENAHKIVTLCYAAKQSEHCLVVPIRLHRAIKSYLRERVEPYMKRIVLGLSQSFNDIKNLTLPLLTTTSREIVEDTLKSWKIKNLSYLSVLRSKDEPLRGFEDDKFWYVASRRGQRPRELCPIDSTTFETLKVQHANINLEDLETDHEDWMKLQQADDIPCEVVDTISHDSNAMETNGGDADDDKDDEEEDGKEETSRAADIPCEVVDTRSQDSDAKETDGGDADDDKEDGKEETSRAAADDDDDIMFKPAKRVREVRSIDSDATEINGCTNNDDVGDAFKVKRYNRLFRYRGPGSTVPRPPPPFLERRPEWRAKQIKSN